MRILVTNDDGMSKGLLALVEEGLRRGHEIIIVTTEGQRSASSKSVTFRMRYRESEISGCRAYIVDSTPASGVAFVLEFVDSGFDLVLSGVNEGANLGTWDILSSGTVGAVLEAALRGLKGIAVSLAARTRAEYRFLSDEPFRRAAEITYRILEQLPSSWTSPILNINVPTFGTQEITVTFPENSNSNKKIYKCSNGSCEFEEWDLYRTYTCRTEGSDVCAVQLGLTSVTPLNLLSVGDLEWLARHLGDKKE